MSKWMIVDDEPLIRRSLRAAVQRMGIAVDTCASAEEAMRRFDDHALILTDMRMSGASGLDLYNWVDGRAPVVVMTGFCSWEAQREMAARDIPMLWKPLTREVVQGLVSRYAPWITS